MSLDNKLDKQWRIKIMSTAIIENTDEIVCTLEFKMKLKEWKQISKTLGSNACYSEIKIINDIRDLVNQLEKTFYSDRKD